MTNTPGQHALVPLVLRLTLAVVFLFHGSELVFGPNSGLGTSWMDAKVKTQDPAATPPPVPVQLAVAWGELLGGAAMLLGFLTRLAALGLTIIMAGAIALVHGKNGFSIEHGGFEYNFVIIAICVTLMIGGGGLLAVDRLLGRRPAPARPSGAAG